MVLIDSGALAALVRIRCMRTSDTHKPRIRNVADIASWCGIVVILIYSHYLCILHATPRGLRQNKGIKMQLNLSNIKYTYPCWWSLPYMM